MTTSAPLRFMHCPGRLREVTDFVSILLLLVCPYAMSAVAQGAPLHVGERRDQAPAFVRGVVWL